MPAQEVLVLAMTHMRSGICTAGFTNEPDPVTHLRWVRPVKPHTSLMTGDMTDSEGRVAKCFDVLEMALQRPRAQPPHTEDVLTDFVYHRPVVRRRLDGESRARFLASHCDHRPEDVLVHQSRSLCLVHPDEVWAGFSLDRASGALQARMGFGLGGLRHEAASSRGVAVTDVKWRALDRLWLKEGPDALWLDARELERRLRLNAVYLAVGLSRGHEGRYWLMVVGVHMVPDYTCEIDYSDP